MTLWTCVSSALSIHEEPVLRLTHIDSRETLLRSVFDGPSAALGQVARSVLRLRLYQNLQLFAFAFLRILTRQYHTFVTGCLWSLRTKKTRTADGYQTKDCG